MSNSELASAHRRSPVPKDICPMALAAEAIGDRWTLLILREAFFGVVRFEDMAADLGIARSVLTDRLKRLVDARLLEQVNYKEKNSRARACYRLTEAGRGTGPIMVALMQWGEQVITRTAAPIQLLDRRDGQGVKLQMVRDDGDVAAFDQIAISLRR
jgi:DNA-binding HxlR family transcriptional regulator